MSERLNTVEEREAYILKRQCESDISVLEKFPQYINIETTNVCNARCVMCAIDFDSRVKQVMKDDLFDKIVAELHEWRHHVKKVNLYSDNEPLLDKDLARKIKVLKNAGIQAVAIASNASALTENRAREIIEAGLDQIYITIDSLVPERYEKIRVGLKFEQVYQNTRRFIEIRDELGAKTEVRLQMVLQNSNDEEKNTFAEHWEPLLNTGDRIVVHKAHNWGGSIDTPERDGDDVINSFPCTTIWANATIHSDGKMAQCSVDTEQFSPHSHGDVYKGSIEEAWNGKKIRALRYRHLNDKRHTHPMCNGCTTWRESKNAVYIEIDRSDEVVAKAANAE